VPFFIVRLPHRRYSKTGSGLSRFLSRFAGKTPVSRKQAFFRRQEHFSEMMQANNTSPLLDGDKKRLSGQRFHCHETVTENLLDDHER